MDAGRAENLVRIFFSVILKFFEMDKVVILLVWPSY